MLPVDLGVVAGLRARHWRLLGLATLVKLRHDIQKQMIIVNRLADFVLGHWLVLRELQNILKVAPIPIDHTRLERRLLLHILQRGLLALVFQAYFLFGLVVPVRSRGPALIWLIRKAVAYSCSFVHDVGLRIIGLVLLGVWRSHVFEIRIGVYEIALRFLDVHLLLGSPVIDHLL